MSRIINFWVLLTMLFISAGSTHAQMICGNNGTVLGGYGNGWANYVYGGNTCTPSSDATVSKVGIKWSTAAGNIAVAVYADGGGKPTGAPICSTGSVAAVSGAQEIDISGCGTLLRGATYWIITALDNNSASIGYASSGHGLIYAYQHSTFPAFPTGGSWVTGDAILTIYLQVTSLAGPRKKTVVISRYLPSGDGGREPAVWSPWRVLSAWLDRHPG